MEKICLTIESNGGVAFSIDMDDIVHAELPHNEILSINEAVKHLKIYKQGIYIAIWTRTSKELRLL